MGLLKNSTDLFIPFMFLNKMLSYLDSSCLIFNIFAVLKRNQKKILFLDSVRIKIFKAYLCDNVKYKMIVIECFFLSSEHAASQLICKDDSSEPAFLVLLPFLEYSPDASEFRSPRNLSLISLLISGGLINNFLKDSLEGGELRSIFSPNQKFRIE